MKFKEDNYFTCPLESVLHFIFHRESLEGELLLTERAQSGQGGLPLMQAA